MDTPPTVGPQPQGLNEELEQSHSAIQDLTKLDPSEFQRLGGTRLEKELGHLRIELGPLQRASFQLAKWVLSGCFIMLFSLVILFFWQNPRLEDIPLEGLAEACLAKATASGSLEDLKAAGELQAQSHRLLLELRKDFFQSWLELVKTVVLITLVPILTSLLGYTFGNQASTTARQ